MPNSNQSRSNPAKSSTSSQGRGEWDRQSRGNAETDSRSASDGAAARSGSRASRSNTGSGRTSNRGFASMDPQRQREIAAQGGRAAHASGNAHQFNSEEARAAGRKGGEANRNRANSERSQR